MSNPWMKFYPTDWRADPALRMCSIGARGLWMEMLCVMHEATPRGTLSVNGRAVTSRQLASLAGSSVDEVDSCLQELEEAGVFSRGTDGTIYSRRMQRDDEKAAIDKNNGLKGGHPDIKRGTVPKEERVRRFRRSDAPAKARRIFEASAGSCYWCQEVLDPEHYHIDHVVAVRDGGTNVENNLVASCPACNGERAMISGRSDADLMVGKRSDHKAQKPEARDQIPSYDFKEKSSEGEVAALPPKPRVSKPKASRLSPDWQPSSEELAYAKAQGMPDLAISREVEKFRNHWTATGRQNAAKLDWSATWRNWVLKACEWGGYAPAPEPAAAADEVTFLPDGRVFVLYQSEEWEACARKHKDIKGLWPQAAKLDRGMGWYFPSEYLAKDAAA